MLALTIHILAFSAPSRPRPSAWLKARIANFYDRSSAIWESSWGEHMCAPRLASLLAVPLTMVSIARRHHGYYALDGSTTNDRQAQVDMIEKALHFGRLAPSPQTIVDVGCGIGGSARHLARKYNASVVGITLSPVQAERAAALSAAEPHDVAFAVADAMRMPFPDGSFDVVWSLESGEHMPDKRRFVSECARVCRPGGSIVMLAWCRRPGRLNAFEEMLLAVLSTVYCLPGWSPPEDFLVAMHRTCEEVQYEDWTPHVRPFWGAVVRSSLKPHVLWQLLRSSPATLAGALVMPLMILGQRVGVIRFCAFAARKADARGGKLLRSPAISAKCVDRPATWKLRDVVAFTRPHTMVGTAMSVVSLCAYAGGPTHATLASAAGALLPAMASNVCIVGVNQVFDVAIDRMNKPYLPLASGKPTRDAVLICAASGTIAATALLAPWSTPSLAATVGSSLAIGMAYSVPPLRLKRSAGAAALSIALVRGLIVNVGFVAHAMGVQAAWQAVCVTAATPALFFSGYGVAIAVLKDVPDVAGDATAGIATYAVRRGAEVAFRRACRLLAVLLSATAAALVAAPVSGATVPRIVASVVCVLWARSHARASASPGAVDTRAHYMQVWYQFYIAYLVLPLLRPASFWSASLNFAPTLW